MLLTETIHYCVAYLVNECVFYSVHILIYILAFYWLLDTFRSASGDAHKRIYVKVALI